MGRWDAGLDKWWETHPEPPVEHWTDWDYALLYAFQMMEDLTDPQSGQFMPYDQSDKVWWEPVRTTSGYLRAVETETEKSKTKPGERISAKPVFMEPTNPPTIESWLKEMEDGPSAPPEFMDARPPTPEELAALRAKD